MEKIHTNYQGEIDQHCAFLFLLATMESQQGQIQNIANKATARLNVHIRGGDKARSGLIMSENTMIHFEDVLCPTRHQ